MEEDTGTNTKAEKPAGDKADAGAEEEDLGTGTEAEKPAGDKADSGAEDTKQREKKRRRLRCHMCIPVRFNVNVTFSERGGYEGGLYGRLADTLANTLGGEEEQTRRVTSDEESMWLRTDEGRQWMDEQSQRILQLAATLDDFRTAAFEAQKRAEGRGSDQAGAGIVVRSGIHDIAVDSNERRKAEAQQAVKLALEAYYGGIRLGSESRFEARWCRQIGTSIASRMGGGWKLQGTEPAELILDEARFYHLRKDGCLSLSFVVCPTAICRHPP